MTLRGGNPTFSAKLSKQNLNRCSISASKSFKLFVIYHLNILKIIKKDFWLGFKKLMTYLTKLARTAKKSFARIKRIVSRIFHSELKQREISRRKFLKEEIIPVEIFESSV